MPGTRGKTGWPNTQKVRAGTVSGLEMPFGSPCQTCTSATAPLSPLPFPTPSRTPSLSPSSSTPNLASIERGGADSVVEALQFGPTKRVGCGGGKSRGFHNRAAWKTCTGALQLYDEIRGQCCTSAAERWCLETSSQRSSSASLSKFGDEAARQVAEAWRSKMQWLCDRALGCFFCFFSAAVLAEYVESPGVQELFDQGDAFRVARLSVRKFRPR